MIRRTLMTALPLVPERALLIANRYPRIRNLLREAFTEAPKSGLAEGKIGRGPAAWSTDPSRHDERRTTVDRWHL